MICCGKERGSKFWIKVAIFAPMAIVAGAFIFGYAVMYLWNHTLPEAVGFQTITFWQALGMLVLAKILFGGCHGKHIHHKFHRHAFKEKWNSMSTEEKEKYSACCWCRCGHHAKGEPPKNVE